METAEEAVEPAEPDINELCTDMFEKMAIFLQGELTGVLTYYTRPHFVKYSLHTGTPIFLASTLIYWFSYIPLFFFVMHIHPTSLHVQELARITACWRT